jgi:hypothetical protein
MSTVEARAVFNTLSSVQDWEPPCTSPRKRLGEINRRMCEKEREERMDLAAIVIILTITIVLSGFFVNSILNQPSTSHPLIIQPSTTEPINPASGRRAAIVDQESLTFPNQTFIQAATSILTQTGYAVDYYSGEQVTVDFYRNLPTHNYSLILLRVHSTVGPAFFTSEPYSSSYFNLKLFSLIGAVSYYRGGPIYFAICPSFVTSYMGGSFNGSIIIAMGCYGMESNDMAEAFVEEGAKAYVGWSGSVSASHTDSAIIRLLKHLLMDNRTLTEAVDQTMQNVGADPDYKSVLLSFTAGQATAQPKQNESDNGDYGIRSNHPVPR